jgi:hypothetical protein
MVLLVVQGGVGNPLALEATGQVKVQDGKPAFTSEQSEDQPSLGYSRNQLDYSNLLI